MLQKCPPDQIANEQIVTTMHSLGDMSKSLKRTVVYVSGLQARFELPVTEGAEYSNAYLEFLRAIITLRTLNISEETLRDLWHLEKKLLQLIHVDSAGSPTWFLDSCGATTHTERRLLLTNHDLGIPLTGSEVQTGLNFADSLPELFAGKEMGENAMRVLRRLEAEAMATANKLERDMMERGGPYAKPARQGVLDA